MKLIDILVQELPKRGGWPEYGIDVRTYYGLGFSWHAQHQGEWIAANYHGETVTREQYESDLAASKVQEWDGVGLPPIGCECEAFDGVLWFPVVIVGRYDGFAFAWNYDYRKTLAVNEEHSKNFRPIRTEAERKREEIVEAIRMAIESSDQDISFNEAIYLAIAAGKITGVYIK